MNQKKFLKDYQTFLEAKQDQKRAVKEKAYLYSDLKHYGLKAAIRRQFLKQHKTWIKQLSKKAILSLIKQLWAEGIYEKRIMALEILQLHKDKLNIQDMPLIEKLMRESQGWALLDNLIIPLMPTILEKNKKAYRYLHKWIKDDDYWVRRSALLAQLLFFRYDEGGDRDLFFLLAKSQFDENWIEEIYSDREQIKRARFFIRKAIGWTLREMSKTRPEIVFKFLQKNKNAMSGLSFREGSRKLPEKYQQSLSKT